MWAKAYLFNRSSSGRGCACISRRAILHYICVGLDLMFLYFLVAIDCICLGMCCCSCVLGAMHASEYACACMCAFACECAVVLCFSVCICVSLRMRLYVCLSSYLCAVSCLGVRICTCVVVPSRDVWFSTCELWLSRYQLVHTSCDENGENT